MSEAGSPGRAERAQRLVTDLGAAFQLRAAYAATHPQVQGAIARTIGSLGAWLADDGSTDASLMVVEGHLLVSREAIPEDANWTRGLLRAFARNDVRGLTLRAGLDAAELGRFLDGCLGAQGAVSSEHLLVGRAGFSGVESTEGSGAAPAALPVAAPLDPVRVEGAREELRSIGDGAATRIDRLRVLVAELARSAPPVPPEAIREAAGRLDDREFLHGLGVAVATLRMGRALGLVGRPLEDLVLAGFLHDVGHLGGPEADPDPAVRRRLHPARGAARLASLDGIPDVAVLVAFDHHLRFDGAPAYPAQRSPRIPVAAARVVAVADAWETFRGQGEIGPEETVAILRARAGSALDPDAVELLAGIVLPPATGGGPTRT